MSRRLGGIDLILDELVAVCGPSCTRCPAYAATRSGDRAELERVAAEWSQSLGRAYTADDVICDGCRVQGGRHSAYCATCEIRLCAEGKGHMTCAHCPDGPCAKIVAPPALEALAGLRKAIQAGLVGELVCASGQSATRRAVPPHRLTRGFP